MRGFDLCRSHRDPIFGPRSGGAPKGNRNAVKTGVHTHSLSPNLIRRLAHHLVSEPDQYLDHMTWALKKLHYSKDPCISLQILITLIRQLQPQVADNLFVRELDAFVEQWPPEVRTELRAQAWQSMNATEPVRRLYLFREAISQKPPPGIDNSNSHRSQ